MYVILPLMIAHLLGDFYFQTQSIASEKTDNTKKLLLHSLIYFICVFICLKIFYDLYIAAGISALVGISHLIIDLISVRTKKKLRSDGTEKLFERYIYLLDQSAHIAIVAIIAVIFFVSDIFPGGVIGDMIPMPFEAMVFITCILLIGKPSNITIKTLISVYKPIEQEIIEEKKTGGLIGILERLLMLIFLFVNQYVALGLVLTAKSIARYKRISEDKAFGEYFLLGTLLSVIMVVLPFILFQYILMM